MLTRRQKLTSTSLVGAFEQGHLVARLREQFARHGTLCVLLTSVNLLSVGCKTSTEHAHEDAGSTAQETRDTSGRTTTEQPSTDPTVGAMSSQATTDATRDTTTTTTASAPADAASNGSNSLDAGGPIDTRVDGATQTLAQTDADSGVTSTDGTSSDALLAQARAEYRDWEPRTQTPINISVQIFALCRAPSAAENAFVDSVHGDELALQDWLNDEARMGIEAFESSPDASVDAFPVGATIVKEKLVLNVNGDYELAALGLMIKREAGFNPDNGDWQFGYWEPETGMLSSSAEQTYCGDCHALAGTDFVYVDDSWRLPD